MSKTQQKELLLQSDMLGHKNDPKKGPLGLRGQGFYAEKQSERFKAGRPDVRVARKDLGQLDFELKYIEADVTKLKPGEELDLTFTKLQWLNLRTMNEHGIPAVGLVFLEQLDVFMLTVDMVLRGPLLRPTYGCLKLPAPQVIDGVALFQQAKRLLDDRRYDHIWRF